MIVIYTLAIPIFNLFILKSLLSLIGVNCFCIEVTSFESGPAIVSFKKKKKI
jgi:hypothetical protein